MAFYRRRYRRKGYRRRRRQVPWYRKKYNVAQVAGAALRGVNYIRGLVNSEKFKHDLIGSSAVSQAGVMTHITNISQGDGEGQRTGNSIFVRNVNIRGSLIKSTSATVTRVRLMLIVDKQQINDTAPAPSDVLDSVGTSNSVYSFLNNDTVGRFTILKSRLYSLTEDTPVINVNWNFNLRRHVRYNGAGATDIQRGGIYILQIGTESANFPSFDRAIRVSYHDN